MPLSREPTGFSQAPSFGAAPVAHGQLDDGLEAQADDYDYEDDEEYEDEEPPRRTRYGLIAASLVVAIAAGGGLAYGYKAYISSPGQTASAAPVVKSGSAPVKIKPVDAGGTKFANTDSKMMDSLNGSSDGGPRAVQTMTIAKDGTIITGSTPAPAPPAPAGGVPGMILVGAQQPSAPTPQPAQVAPPAPAPPAARPIVIAAASPAPAVVADAAPAPVTAPVKKLVKKPIAPAAVGGPTGANGYVAVLASLPASATSRSQAMQQFADLQQKYTGVLGNKAPDIVEAKVADKTYNRLVVGPPASRDAAKAVCDQLKTSGYTADCWVTAF